MLKTLKRWLIVKPYGLGWIILQILYFKLRVSFSTKYLLIRNLCRHKKYSQAGQDYYVWKTFFKGKKHGVFCDVGANHPVKINNTLFFEEMGWTGFAFEPNPKMKPLWKEKRQGTKFYNYGVASEDKKMDFAVVRMSEWDVNGELSFIVEPHQKDQLKECRESKIISLPFRALKNTFAEDGISHIDYLSMDVEHYELEALKGIDFDAVTINVMTVENDETLFGDNRIRKFLKQKGFVFYARIQMLDDVYVRKAFLKNIT